MLQLARPEYTQAQGTAWPKCFGQQKARFCGFGQAIWDTLFILEQIEIPCSLFIWDKEQEQALIESSLSTEIGQG